jgi:hypothetical protein
MSIAAETVHIDGSQIRHFNLAGNSDCLRVEETQARTITVILCGFLPALPFTFLANHKQKMKQIYIYGTTNPIVSTETHSAS